MKFHVIGALITACLNVFFVDGALIAHGASADKYFLIAIWIFTFGACILQGLCYRDLRREFYDNISRVQTDGV